MRAAHLSYSVSRRSGGIFEICRRTVQSLAAEHALEVDVFGLEDEFTRQDLAQWHPLRPRCFAPRWPRAYGYAPELVEAMEKAGPEVVHVHGLWTFPTLAARRWSQRQARPYVVTIHGMLEPWALRQSRWKKKLVGRLVENQSLRDAACLHVNTKTEAQHLRAYGLQNPICVIPNGVDLPAPGASALKAPWANFIPSSARILLYLGRLHPKKGLVNLLEAWAIVQQNRSSASDQWHLLIAGWDQGGHEAKLRSQAAAAGLTETVHFMGPLFGDDKSAAYTHAHGFVLPSYSEGLPMAVLEAWAHSLPVLVTRQCNLPEGPIAGAAFPLEPTCESIVQGLQELFRLDDLQRAEMGQRGRALVRERFDWTQVTRELHRVYRWLLNRGPQPACVITE